MNLLAPNYSQHYYFSLNLLHHAKHSPASTDDKTFSASNNAQISKILKLMRQDSSNSKDTKISENSKDSGKSSSASGEMQKNNGASFAELSAKVSTEDLTLKSEIKDPRDYAKFSKIS